MVDFTSALYLGLSHASRTLGEWSQLTSGRPSALAETREARVAAARLAQLMGCESATLAPSTLHAFWDLFSVLGRQPATIFLDEGAYLMARCGVEHAAAQGAQVVRCPHQDAEALAQAVARDLSGRRPVVVTDGLCPISGRAAPLEAYLEVVRRHRGWLVVDDTQALGILGESPAPEAPYGRGGGGVLRFVGRSGPDIVVVASLAKGFGAPIAVLAGSRELLDRVENESPMRRHASPPSTVAVRAAVRALDLNERHGERLRRALLSRVRAFRRGLGRSGLAVEGRLFPVQSLPMRSVAGEWRRLRARGVSAVPMQRRLAFLVTARHRPEELERAALLVSETLAPPRWRCA